MEDVLVPIVLFGSLFIGLPWLVFHYITQWKRSGSLSQEDERLLDELHMTARRLDDRLNSIERIIAADNPGWRPAPPRVDQPIDADPRLQAGREPDREQDWRRHN